MILNNKQRLTDGYNALWGFDGNVYFVRDGAELWCYNMETQEASIIYKPSSGKTWSLRPMMNRERTFLALPCKTGRKMSYILFDLKNKECMNAGNLRNFTWTDNQLTVKWEDL